MNAGIVILLTDACSNEAYNTTALLRGQSRYSLIPLCWERKGMTDKKTNLEHYFSIEDWVLMCISLENQSKSQNHSKMKNKNAALVWCCTQLTVQKKPFWILKQHPAQYMSGKMGWHYSRICQCIIFSSFSQIAHRHLSRIVSAIFSAKPYLQCVFVKGSKFVHQLCLKIAFTCSAKVVQLAGCSLPNCHASMCDKVLK